jgi:uncharacterized protein affecting Mg2+/Co2+ transport
MELLLILSSYWAGELLSGEWSLYFFAYCIDIRTKNNNNGGLFDTLWIIVDSCADGRDEKGNHALSSCSLVSPPCSYSRYI